MRGNRLKSPVPLEENWAFSCAGDGWGDGCDGCVMDETLAFVKCALVMMGISHV